MSYIQTIDADDLTSTGVTRKYELGVRYVDHSSTDAIKPEYMYIKAHDALTQYQPYQVGLDSVPNAHLITKAPVTTSTGAIVVVPQITIPLGRYFWGQIKGAATVTSTDTFAAEDYAEVLNAGTGLKLDGGASGSTVEAGTTLAIATASTSGGTTAVILSGNEVTIAAA
tara:strand:+ start:11592 stop:12098 length:507 start_codon:yes stop_codon:yes gene_type:complete